MVPKLQSILSSFPNQIKFVVYFDHPLKKNSVFEEDESANSIPSILPLSKIETSGQMLSGLKQGKQSSPKLLTSLNPVKIYNAITSFKPFDCTKFCIVYQILRQKAMMSL